MIINWRDSLATGHELIDEQHKELFKRFNNLLAACNEGRGSEEVLKILLFLGDYVREHFAAEEKLQLKYDYPGYPAHKELHTGFTKTLRELERQAKEGGATVSLVIQTNQTLVNWLITHISGVDKELADYLHRVA